MDRPRIPEKIWNDMIGLILTLRIVLIFGHLELLDGDERAGVAHPALVHLAVAALADHADLLVALHQSRRRARPEIIQVTFLQSHAYNSYVFSDFLYFNIVYD